MQQHSQPSTTCAASTTSGTRDFIRRCIVPLGVPIRPSPLTFLDDVPGFHAGRLSSPHLGRFPYVYDAQVQDFEMFLVAVGHTLASRNGDPIMHRASLCPDAVSALYTAFGLAPSYRIEDILATLVSALDSVLDTSTVGPIYQRLTLDMLPFELLEMVVACATERSVLQFSTVNRRIRSACVQRLWKTARFVMRFDRAIVTHPLPRGRGGVRVVGESMVTARLACEESIRGFLRDDERRTRVRSIAFDNEWERLCPAAALGVVMPSPYMIFLFGPLYTAMAHALGSTMPSHVHITSLGVTTQLLALITRHPSVRSLSLTCCYPAIFQSLIDGQPSVITLTNIRFLAVGFGGRPRWDPDPAWRVITHFSSLQHLLIHGCDADDPVDWPWPYFDDLPPVCFLQTLHLHGMDSDMFSFACWLQSSVSGVEQPPRLTSLKLHTAFGIDEDDFEILLVGLDICRHSLRVLALDAFHEGLTIFKRPVYMTGAALYKWSAPVYEYANALAQAVHLLHFESNMDWSPLSYTPRTMDTLLALGGDPSSAFARSGDATRCSRGELDERDDLMDDGYSIILPFAATCVRLESFIIRATLAVLSCTIRRRDDGSYELQDLVDREHIVSDERWNPAPAHSWGQLGR